MPWSLQTRDGKYCVVKQGETEPVPGGCHSSRADAIKHQRALYANESRMASIYAELDALPDPEPEPEVEPAPVLVATNGPRTMTIEIPSDDHLTASVMAQMERMNERQARNEAALVAALEAIGSKESVVNVHTPPAEINVNVPPAEVSVTVPPAEVNVTVPPAEVTVQAPDVNVTVEAPATQKTVTFERDPLTNQVVKAEVSEA